MAVDWNGEVVDQLESHWRHQLRPRLTGLTDDEYFWQPVPDCWTISPRGASQAPMSFGAGEYTMDFGEPVNGREPVTTIAWRLGHLIVGFAETNGTHFGGPAVQVRHLVRRERRGSAASARWRVRDVDPGVRRLGTAGLAIPQGPTQPPEFADGTTHLVHERGSHPPRCGDLSAP